MGSTGVSNGPFATAVSSSLSSPDSEEKDISEDLYGEGIANPLAGGAVAAAAIDVAATCPTSACPKRLASIEATPGGS